MTKMVELELLKCRNYHFTVVPFVEHTEGQGEYRIAFIHTLQIMVTTFVDIDDIF